MIPKKLNKFEKLDKRVIKCKKRVSTYRLEATWLWPNLGLAVSLESKADVLSG